MVRVSACYEYVVGGMVNRLSLHVVLLQKVAEKVRSGSFSWAFCCKRIVIWTVLWWKGSFVCCLYT